MEKKKEISPILRIFQDGIGLTLGTGVLAVAVQVFLVPGKLAPGGFSGVSSILFHSLGWPVEWTYPALNIPVFFIAFWVLGGKFGVKSLLMSLALSGALFLANFIPYQETDPLLSSVFGGGLAGLGIGFLLRNGATTGGTELLAKIIQRGAPFFSVGRWLMVLDALVILGAILVFGEMTLGLYSLLSLFIATRVVDGVIEGVDFAKEVMIISDEHQSLKEKILSQLDRGVTLWSGKGGYSGEERMVLFCVIRPRELPTLRSLVLATDPGAFVVVHDAREVLGEGFRQRGRVW